MDKCKLSIVIPLYNSKDYFPICLDSIYSQGLDEALFEVIVVDDGSNDGVEAFADRAATAHTNMRVVHQANTGSPSIPRNRGLEMASGKFVFFCDSDDAFLPGSLEKMIMHAEQDELDIGLFNLDSNGRSVGYGGLFENEMKHCSVFNSKITNFLGPYKLFRVSFLRSHNLSFPNTYYEDISFVLEAYLLSENTCIYNDGPYYFIRLRDDESSMTQSGTTRYGANSLENRLLGLEYLAHTVSQYYSSSECPQIYNRLFEKAAMLLKSCFRGGDPEENIGRLRAILAPCYSSEVKELLNIRCNMLVSALLNTSISLSDFRSLVFCWPNGPACSFSSRDNRLIFRQFNRSGQVVDEGSTPPLKSIWTESIQSRFCIIDTSRLEMRIADGKARYGGHSILHADTFKQIESAQLTCTSKSAGTATFELQIFNFEQVIVSTELGLSRFSFDWQVEFGLASLLPADIDACTYALYLSISTDTGSYSFRLGLTAEEQVRQSYIRSYSYVGSDLFFGTFTQFGNANISVRQSVPGFFVSVLSADVDAHDNLLLRILLMLPPERESDLFSVGYRNRRSGKFVAVSDFSKNAAASLEAAVPLDESLCRLLLPESEEDDVWDFQLKLGSPDEGNDRFVAIGSHRPAGSLALLRQHPCMCDDYAFICYQNKQKNLSVVVQSKLKVLDDARNLRILSVSCGDHRIMLDACLDAKSVALRPQLKLAYRNGGRLFDMQGESYDLLDKRFRHEIRATFDIDDLLEMYDNVADDAVDDRWNLETIVSFVDQTKSYPVGSKRPKGSLARYQKAACVRNGIVALPFETKEKNLFIRVASASLLAKNETTLTVSDACYETGGIRIRGTVETPLLLYVDSLHCSLCQGDINTPLDVALDVSGGGHPHAEWSILIPSDSPVCQATPESMNSFRLSFSFAVGTDVYHIPVQTNESEITVTQDNASLHPARKSLKLEAREDGIAFVAFERKGVTSLLSGLFRRR